MNESYVILFIVILSCVLIDNTVTGQYYVNPCFGRDSGFARDFHSCAHFWACRNGMARRGMCQNGNFFNAERETCVRQQDADCFKCPENESYRLLSVPRACQQYIRCFFDSPTLHACPNGLVFDGRRAVRNCNHQPANGGCHREDHLENEGNPAVTRCPWVGNRPVYIPDTGSCAVYYICSRINEIPERRECGGGLHFNHRLGVCDLPQSAGCQTNNPGPPTRPPNPPNWGPGPAIPCPIQGGVFVPDRVNCNRYHACTSGGIATPVNCAPSLHFCYITTECRLPANARCWSNENRPPGQPWTISNSTFNDLYELQVNT